MEKRTRRLSDAKHAVPPLDTNRASIDRDQIAVRAFDLFCRRGYHHGHDVDDWLQAEHELRMMPDAISSTLLEAQSQALNNPDRESARGTRRHPRAQHSRLPQAGV